MPRCLKRWSRWCQQAFFLLVRCCCSLERELSALSYSHSALDVWSWSSLRMSSKHSICFLGCSGDRIIASVDGIDWEGRFKDSAQVQLQIHGKFSAFNDELVPDLPALLRGQLATCNGTSRIVFPGTHLILRNLVLRVGLEVLIGVGANLGEVV